ncbi:MAG: YkvI family membrane protein [Senegalia sp. (in: firmicutes)]
MMKLFKTNNMSVPIGVAFVWFTTQFGGGFASGAQLFQYFIIFGIWTLITPILAQVISAVFQWYALKYAKVNDVYDYRSFNDSFYGKFSPIFSNLYELVYIFLLCLAPSVAFATGGSTMAELLGIPYLICTMIIGVFIFIIAVYGTDIVRKAASAISIIIILGLLIVYIPNIIAQWGEITKNIGNLAAQKAPIGPALWKSFLYAAFQLASIGLMVQHAKAFTSEKEAKTSMIYGVIINSGIIFISTLGLMAVVNMPGIQQESIPILTLVRNGVGSSFMTPMISILIVLGAISTAVNMIAGIVNRIVSKFEIEKPLNAKDRAKPSKLTIFTTAGFIILAFGIAQFGLLPLIKVGYGYLGYITIAVVIIPYIIHMIFSGLGKTKKIVKNL